MKALRFFFLFLGIVSLHSLAEAPPKEEPKVLHSKLLGIADGKFITAQHIGFTLQIRLDLNNMLNGQKDVHGIYKGLFIVNHVPCTIKDLLSLELAYATETQTLQNSLLSSETKHALEELNRKKLALQHTLEEVRHYFIEKILPFAEHADGMQDLMFSLIADSCEQRNRTNSFLLTWAECPPGKEAELLTKEIKTFQILDVFITDLINFLTDFVHSCPKARKQFLAMIKEKNSPTKKTA